MHNSHRFCLFLVIAAFVAPSFGHAAAKESLYDAKSATKVSPAMQAIFGPQSGKYRYDSRMMRAAEMAAARMAAARKSGGGGN